MRSGIFVTNPLLQVRPAQDAIDELQAKNAMMATLFSMHHAPSDMFCAGKLHINEQYLTSA